MSSPGARVMDWQADIWSNPASLECGGGAAYGTLVAALRGFLDDVAAAAPDEAVIAALADDLRAWSAKLAPFAVAEERQIFGHRLDLPGRGQTMIPELEIDEIDDRSARGRVTFGRYFLGGNGAAHGGTISLVFDDLLGRLANLGGRARARTAYLNVNYRSITPIDVPLEVRASFESEIGRKRLLRAELWHGDILCADGEGLFVELRPGQP